MRHEHRTDLAALERELLAAIDAGAEARQPFRLNAHLFKEAEALALMKQPEIADAEIPHIAAEAAETGNNRFNIAVIILNKAKAARERSAAIDAIRRAAKQAVREATTPIGKRRAADIAWPAEVD